MASGGGDDGSSSLKTVVLNSEEMIEEVDVITMAAGRSLSVEHSNLEGGAWNGGTTGLRCCEQIL